jgi:hypothetical protein
MILFKSPIRRRAEKMIEEINNQRAEIVIKRQGISHKAEEFSKTIVDENRMNTEVKILTKLLSK